MEYGKTECLQPDLSDLAVCYAMLKNTAEMITILNYLENGKRVGKHVPFDATFVWESMR